MKGRLSAVAAALLLAAAAFGHDLDFSAIRIVVRQRDVLVGVTVVRSKLRGASPDDAVRRRLKLAIDGAPFIAGETHVIVDAKNDLVTWQATAPRGVGFAAARRLFPEDDGSKTLVTVTREGRLAEEALLDAAHPGWNVGDEGSGRFLSLGVGHILSGPDHVLFVIGLVLLGGSLRSLLKTVSAFTLAHSITLTVVATGLWTPPSRIVEPLIALSIVAVALENLRAKAESARDHRPGVAFAFGLVHGFGFAGRWATWA